LETTTGTNTPVRPATIALTDKAAAKVAEFLKAEDNPEFFLRVAVQPGGCSGLRYALYFDDRKLDGDEETLLGDVSIRVDRMSAPYLRGATLDWLETLEQSGFQINNPNAMGSCACGDSFH
jgi:iron-sulfur cluster assembly accessory protein